MAHNFGACGGKPPKIVKCSCKNEYQDEVYGKGLRLANRAKPKEKGNTFRCTVCLAMHYD